MDIGVLIIGVILGFLLAFLFLRGRLFEQKKQIQQEALKGSRSSIMGELYEKILPALPDFPYAPKDMVFVGKGCDYIIFDGLSEGRLREVVFLELKSGRSSLNANERMIRDIISTKKIRYSEYRIASRKNGD